MEAPGTVFPSFHIPRKQPGNQGQLNSHAGGGQSRARKVLIKFHSPLLWEGPIWGFQKKPLQPSEEEELSTEDE